MGQKFLERLEVNKIYNMDFREAIEKYELPNINLVATDPPYNIGFKYNEYKDVMEDDDLLDGIEKEDIDFYEDMLSDLTLNVDNSSKLLNKSNHNSMIKLMEYCCKEDIDPDKWFIDYFNHNSNYIKDQKQNFIKMKNSLEKYIVAQKVA